VETTTSTRRHTLPGSTFKEFEVVKRDTLLAQVQEEQREKWREASRRYRVRRRERQAQRVARAFDRDAV
jgi:hypothetical protein